MSACSVWSCVRPKRARDLCQAHYDRLMKYGDVRADDPIRRKVPAVDGRFPRSGGYVTAKCPRTGRWMAEHRVVMEGVLGRELLSSEEVHHINGVKTDNRPENLELWIVSQPKGQRPEDLVAWAHEILATYSLDTQPKEKARAR